MPGFFTVTDVPSRRVVQYKRVSGSAEGAVYLEDESVLGKAVDEMPYSDKTGIAVSFSEFAILNLGLDSPVRAASSI